MVVILCFSYHLQRKVNGISCPWQTPWWYFHCLLKPSGLFVIEEQDLITQLPRAKNIHSHLEGENEEIERNEFRCRWFQVECCYNHRRNVRWGYVLVHPNLLMSWNEHSSQSTLSATTWDIHKQLMTARLSIHEALYAKTTWQIQILTVFTVTWKAPENWLYMHILAKAQ